MSINKEIFLITGAAGFVGARLTHALVNQGACVHVIIMKATDAWRLASIRDKITIHEIDITDTATLTRAVKIIQPTVIYHLAAHGAYPSQQDPKRILNTNVMGTWSLLEALESIPYKLLVNTGSSSEYGYKKTPMKETDTINPNSFYAVSKANQTALCHYVAMHQQRPIVTFRLFSIYGPLEEPSRLVPTAIRHVIEQQPLKMANPATARDFVFIDDAVLAYLAIDKLIQYPGETFNIASGCEHTLKDFVGSLSKAVGHDIAVNWHAYPSRLWDTSCWVGDTHKTQQLLGWQVKTPLSEGLKKTYDWTLARVK